MKITYIHQYFKTPVQGGAIRSYHIAKAMINAGHEVSMITSFNGKKLLKKNIDGISVYYLPVLYDNKMSFGKRVWSFLRFTFKSYQLAKTLPTDLVYATSTPLTVGLIALLLKINLGFSYIFEVRDLWPEAPKQLGFIKNPLLLRALVWLEKRVYREAKNIIALSPGIAKGILKFTEPSKVIVVSNFADNSTSLTSSVAKNTFKICYTGALGYANDISFLLKVIDLVGSKFKESVTLDIMGEGKFAYQIEARCRAWVNCSYSALLSKKDVFDKLFWADANLITFLPYPVLETNSPNKFFDGLAMGNVSIINFGGWIDQLINDHRCGVRVTEYDLEKVLNELINNPRDLVEMKENAKFLAQNIFDKDILCQRVLDTLGH